MGRIGEDYAPASADARTVLGPLFEQPAAPDPFAFSSATPTEDEKRIALLIAQHRGSKNPVNIARIQALTGIQPRVIKGIVEDLRNRHEMPIGGRREEPSGYFWIVDAADIEAAVAPYRRQILTMWRTLRRLDSRQKLQELRDLMTVEDDTR